MNVKTKNKKCSKNAKTTESPIVLNTKMDQYKPALIFEQF